MTIDLNPEQQRVIDMAVQAGAYENPGEVASICVPVRIAHKPHPDFSTAPFVTSDLAPAIQLARSWSRQ